MHPLEAVKIQEANRWCSVRLRDRSFTAQHKLWTSCLYMSGCPQHCLFLNHVSKKKWIFLCLIQFFYNLFGQLLLFWMGSIQTSGLDWKKTCLYGADKKHTSHLSQSKYCKSHHSWISADLGPRQASKLVPKSCWSDDYISSAEIQCEQRWTSPFHCWMC